MRENNDNSLSISIADIWRIFLKRWFLILLVGAIVAAGVGYFLNISYKEQYTSKSTIMVMNPEKNLSASSSAYYYSLTITAVNDCERLMTSRTVLYQIINELELTRYGINYSNLKNMISISNYPDSHVLEVSVTAGDPEIAKQIVDLVCTKGAAMIEEYIEFATARVIDEGTINRYPSNNEGYNYAIIFGVLAAALVLVIYVIKAMSDDRIATPEDVESYLGLSVLGRIPYAESKRGKNSYSYYKGGKTR